MKSFQAASVLAVFAGLGLSTAVAQNPPRSAADSVRGHFVSVNRRVLEMAKDFPEDSGTVFNVAFASAMLFSSNATTSALVL